MENENHQSRLSELKALARPLSEKQDNPASRLRLALLMMETGIDMKRTSLRREFPEDSSEQLIDRLRSWLCDQPIAPGLRPRQLSFPLP
jgi:hypothetical protein